MARLGLSISTVRHVVAGMGCVFLGITTPGPWAQPAGDPIAISGSSTVGPITEMAIKGFQGTARGKTVRFGRVVENGTSAGFREFCSGKTAISNASRPINSKELAACKAAGVSFYELPIGFDAITVVVHPSNTWARDITVGELKKLWSRTAQNKVMRWNQVRSSWPPQPIKLFSPGRDSGTFDYFTKAITGEQGNSRVDTISSENDNVLVKGVANSGLGMGYFGFAYYQGNANKLRALPIVGPKGKVQPSVKTVQNETYQPLSRPMFIYVNARQMAAKAPLRNFVEYMLRNASEIVEKEGSVPLSDMQHLLVENKLFRQVQGSAFGGDLPIGLTLGELLNRSIDQNKRPEFRL
jgi:phosphate transport system substrate-binding protein